MHELPVTQNLLAIALRHAEMAHARRITDLYLVLGDLTSIVDDSVQFYWDIISAGTAAEGARLHFQRVPAELACGECGQWRRLNGGSLACPQCGSDQASVVAGEDFYLESIDVEKAVAEERS